MKKSSKTPFYLSLFSLIPLIISLILIPFFSFEMRLSIIIMIPIYVILILLAIRHLRKDLVHYSLRAGKITARNVLIIMTITPIGFFIGILFYNVTFMGIDFVVFILWGATSIIDIIAAILYKPPKEKQQRTVF